MNITLKWYIILMTLICIATVLGAGAAIIYGRNSGDDDILDINIDAETDIITQVGHVDMSDKEGLELIYVDSHNDIAYYRRTDKSYVVENDTVYFNDDSEALVTGSDVYGFYTERVSSIVPGMSGTSVRNEDGKVVGYVEQILNNNIYCIWK